MSKLKSNRFPMKCQNQSIIGARTILALSVAFVCLSVAASAQDTATIVGTVMDSSGAVVPGVKVSVSNPARGFVRDVESNSSGEYTAARIPIGNYVITAEAKGFEKLVRSGISLNAGQTQRVDLSMTVGQLSQEVQVTGNAVQVETESPTLSAVVTSKQIQSLTLNGQNFLALTFLVPGAVQDQSQDEAMQLGHAGSEVNVSFNGNRIEYSQLELDGGNNAQESSTSMGGAVVPALDSIAEFRISTSNYGADVGQHAGALVEVATKGGTKDFHGSAYEFLRNDALDANDWFANQQINPPGGNAPKTPLKWNTFGYTVGGPFYIPKHYNTDKSKTFLFWSQEWAKYRAATLATGSVPTARMRTGDFSECDPTSPNYVALMVQEGCLLPSLDGGKTFTDTVPVDPNAKAMLDGYVPLPNNGVNGYVSAHSVPTNFSSTQIRVDQNLSDKAAMFVRFTSDTWVKTVVPALWSGSSYDTTETAYSVPARQTVLHLNYNFKPNLLNESIFSYTDTPHTISPSAGPGSISHSNLKPSDWSASVLFAANAGNKLLPSVGVSGGVPFGFYVDQGNFVGPFDAEPVFTYRDNVAWTHGRHTFKFGFFLEKFQLREQFGAETQGSYYFNGSTSFNDSTGNGLADMLLGKINSYTEGTFNANGILTGGYGVGHWRRTDFEPYFQDDWKVNSRLTLNFGVRYYLLIPPHDVTKPTVDSGFIPSMYNPAAAAVLGIDGNLHKNPATGQIYDFTGFGNGLVECGAGGIANGCQTVYHGNIGPRFGFAFDPTGSGKTAIRGGYGIYYEPGNGNDANTIGGEGNPPTTLGPTGFYLPSYYSLTPGLYGPTGQMRAIPYHQKNPAVNQFNLNVQHEFRGNNLFSLAYVGNLGRHLDTSRNLNQIPVGVGTMNVPALASGNGGPCDAAGNCNVQQLLMNYTVSPDYFTPYQTYSLLTMKQFTGVSSYHALQADYRHTTGYGLTLEAAYTWSHMIDNSTSTYFVYGNNASVDANYDLNRWKGTSDLNRAQVLEMNYVYALPFFKNSASSFVKGALGGWEVSGITSMFSGEPVDFNCGISGYETGIGTGVRCNTTGPVKINKSTYNDPQFGPMVRWFDPSVLEQPLQSQLLANGEPGMFGYMGRNLLTGPGRNNWDLALHKNVALPWFRGEQSTLQIRLETFNSFNHPQWRYINVGCSGAPNADGSPAFGRSCGGDAYNPGNGEVGSAWAPRNIQLGMRFSF
ncbi:MAG TPA: carboxypeptidase-like regulatory domain-containing protein [Terriglobia bacterium]|nr:carboxypeptidase-like regulatory domain-containing protein [Terriglobia bacterium]